MQTHDWSRFELRIPVYAETQTIYDLWATPAGLEKWFLRSAKFFSASGELALPSSRIMAYYSYEWLWHGWGDETAERGKIISANGKDFFEFVFGKAGIVSVEIKNEQGAAVVELIQKEIPIDEESKINFHYGCSTGWTFYLANLKSISEGGLDLRNKNALLKKVLNS